MIYRTLDIHRKRVFHCFLRRISFCERQLYGIYKHFDQA